MQKIKKKKYRTFPAHMGVQPIPSIISSLKFDTPLEGCSAILCNKFVSSKNFLGMSIPIFAPIYA
jgi:hypothetical protein